MKYSITTSFLLLFSFSNLSYAADPQPTTAPMADMGMHQVMGGMMNNMTEAQKNGSM